MFKQAVATAIVGCIAFSANSARAGFVAFLSSASADSYNYTLRFTPEYAQESLSAGDLVTIYQVAPDANIVSAVINGPDAADFIVTRQTSGIIPPGMIGASGIPSGPLDNITFTYHPAPNGTGPALTAEEDFSATITTTGGFIGTLAGTGAGSTTIVGATEKDTLFPILVPQASGGSGLPEPASLGVLSLGALALLSRRRRI